MSSPYIITGANTGTYPRFEIGVLSQDDYQFSLFIQAMSNLQAENYQPVAASWQEMGGIHGLPYERWSGDPRGPGEPENTQGWEGYCYHASVLFPPWHRVLLMLVEQAVNKEAQNIAAGIAEQQDVSADEKTQWTDAATKLRFPYWDWSDVKVQQTGMPPVFTTEQLDVRGPNGTKLTLVNPLKSYRFHPIPEGATNDEIAGMAVNFADWKQTYRWATPGANPMDNVQELNQALEKGVTIDNFPFTSDVKIRQKLGRIFSFPPTATQKLQPTYWDYFSNTSPQSAAPPDAATIASIEEPHNWVHLTVGGDGDMSFNDLAAFDPIFFFHHCNVDRLYALWEYVYPDYWFGKGYYNRRGQITPFIDQQGTYQEDPGTKITESSPLAPFRKTATQYWTSADVRGLQPGQGANKYYTYPPLELTLSSFQLGRGTAPQPVSSKTVVIDITKPSTPDQRKEYITALQQVYGDNAVTHAQLPVGNPPLFNTSLARSAGGTAASNVAAPALHAQDASEGAMTNFLALPPGSVPPVAPTPETHQAVDGFRDFAVTADVPQFAFKGSHRLELHLDGVRVDDVSVLNRLNPAKCANCVSRMENGTGRVRGVMTLPHAHVVGLLEKHGMNKSETSDEEVVKLLKEHISAHIVNPVGGKLAEAEDGLCKKPMPEGRPVFKEEDHPVLSLHSSRLMLSAPRCHEPHLHQGWVHHGDVLKGEWRFSHRH